MKDPMENFRKNLKEKVEDSKMTQRELAKLLDCDQSSISLWINGKAEPKVSVILKMLEVFDMDFYDLFR